MGVDFQKEFYDIVVLGSERSFLVEEDLAPENAGSVESVERVAFYAKPGANVSHSNQMRDLYLRPEEKKCNQ